MITLITEENFDNDIKDRKFDKFVLDYKLPLPNKTFTIDNKEVSTFLRDISFDWGDILYLKSGNIKFIYLLNLDTILVPKIYKIKDIEFLRDESVECDWVLTKDPDTSNKYPLNRIRKFSYISNESGFSTALIEEGNWILTSKEEVIKFTVKEHIYNENTSYSFRTGYSIIGIKEKMDKVLDKLKIDKKVRFIINIIKWLRLEKL